jgi:hypothetical protein
MSSLLVFTPINLITYSTHSEAFSEMDIEWRERLKFKSQIFTFIVIVYIGGEYAHTLHFICICINKFSPRKCFYCERMQRTTRKQ